MGFVSASGAKSSSEKPRYDLIYRGFLKRLADRLGYGAAVHGERNYEQGAGDAVYRRDRINHLIEHALKYAEGDTSTDHLSAIAANANILAYLDDCQPVEKLPDVAVTDSPVTWIYSGAAGEPVEKLNAVSKYPTYVYMQLATCPCAQGDGAGETAVGGEPV